MANLGYQFKPWILSLSFFNWLPHTIKITHSYWFIIKPPHGISKFLTGDQTEKNTENECLWIMNSRNLGEKILFGSRPVGHWLF